MTGPAAHIPAFDICGPLPTGTTVLEASAGTGKTFTIAALATRYVAEGHAPLPRLLLVTFGRAATAELRERVRDRLLHTERALAAPALARAGDDPLLQMLAAVDDDEVIRRHRRLTTALATFDGATIATTHGFCQQMLAGLGIAGDSDSDATFTESVEDLLTEIVDDLYVRKYGTPDASRPAMSYSCAQDVARAAVGDRQARLEPAQAPEGSEAAARYGLARAARTELEARKRRRRLLDFDDLLTRLRDALADPDRGAAAAERVRSRYSVVLVDEFQDTDPVQWDILRRAFGGVLTLVLIGDPKQAIYAFRGADVCTYLDAASTASTQQTLARNWRSDCALLTALDALFGGAALGHERIVVRPVSAVHLGRRLVGTASAPLRLRVLGRGNGSTGMPTTGMPKVGPVRQQVAADLANDIVGLLNSRAELETAATTRPVRPADVAVLVRTNAHGALVREALRRADVPVVLSGTSSVFATDAAREWLVLLQALEQPHRAGRVRAAALTSFLGWSAADLSAGGEDALDRLQLAVRQWGEVLADQGVAALAERITVGERLPERLLGAIGGERLLTDLRHIGQSLHATAVEGRLGLTALAEWLQRRIAEADADTSEARSRRLESDAEAVQVVTVHRSKGLEFPIVYVPFGWDRYVAPSPDPLHLHDDHGVRVLDVGGSGGPGYDERRTRHQSEEYGEDLRLFYVAVTRAQCQVTTWWAPSTNTPDSATHRLLFGSRQLDGQLPARVPVPSDAEAARVLGELADRAGGTVAVEHVAQVAGTRWRPPPAPDVQLDAASFDRQLDTEWRRTSYSALTAAAHEAAYASPGVGSEPELAELNDEPGDRRDGEALSVPPAEAEDERLRAVPSPMAHLPAGTAFGTAVHAVLETLDPAGPDLPAELLERCAEVVAGRRVAGLDAAALAIGLLPALETPLGPLAAGRRLRDVPRADRLAELDFELPLVGGDDPTARVSLAAVADLLRRYLSPSDPLARYPDLLGGPTLFSQQLRGYLGGSVDAVLRLHTPDGEPRYVVVDYKTNWLGGGPAGSEPLTAWHYRPLALAEAMLAAHYPLQALLYAVALHRFLRWRQPGYDPARHLGGVLYLFVRGMCGAGTPLVDGSPCGVFGWQPPAGLVADLSRLLETGTA